jgi:hypothetical protein
VEDPAGSNATAGLALRVTGTHKPLHHDKVKIPSEGDDMICGMIYDMIYDIVVPKFKVVLRNLGRCAPKFRAKKRRV